MDGGGIFRANFGVEREGVEPAGRGRLVPKGSEITTGYPSSTTSC
jgi:hypothetical protein